MMHISKLTFVSIGLLLVAGLLGASKPILAAETTPQPPASDATVRPATQSPKGDIYGEGNFVFIPMIMGAGSSSPPPSPGPSPNPQPQIGIWISSEEIAKLPTTGKAWENLKNAADSAAGYPDLSNQDDDTNVIILAKALVYARTGQTRYRDEVVAALRKIVYEHTESGGRTLALGRQLPAYVIAADLINLSQVDSELDALFRQKLRELLSKQIEGWGSSDKTLRETHERRANNWGTHAGAARAAVAVYLGDKTELARAAQVFKGWLGDRSSYAGFDFNDDLSWQCDPQRPVGVNPPSCQKNGHSIDGALPEEMRRGGSFSWPPKDTNYPWGGLQGAVVQAEILYRAGYASWDWQNQALLRAVKFLFDIGWQPDGDDRWIVWLINFAYGSTFPVESGVSPGKNLAWTEWTHADYP